MLCWQVSNVALNVTIFVQCLRFWCVIKGYLCQVAHIESQTWRKEKAIEKAIQIYQCHLPPPTTTLPWTASTGQTKPLSFWHCSSTKPCMHIDKMWKHNCWHWWVIAWIGKRDAVWPRHHGLSVYKWSVHQAGQIYTFNLSPFLLVLTVLFCNSFNYSLSTCHYILLNPIYILFILLIS